MFDFGFSERVVICVIALLVLGPTRLPGLVRKVGRWVGKARAMARDFREQLESEVNLEELGRATRQQDTAPPAPGPSNPAPEAESPPSAASSYPYGTPTDVDSPPPPSDTSSASADPAVVADGPQPGDDDYSHSHAPGASPAPWNPAPESGPDAAEPPGTGTDKPAS
jgi:sec-independent protein translocase protein TatB